MVKVYPYPISVERIDMNIRVNQGEMSSISQIISRKIREFCPEIAVATLYKDMSLRFDGKLRANKEQARS